MSKDQEQQQQQRKVNNNNSGLELTPEESAEFSDTLKSLETTMRKHMSALAVTKTGAPSAGAAAGALLATPGSAVPRSLSRLRREGTKLNGVAMPTRSDKVSSL